MNDVNVFHLKQLKDAKEDFILLDVREPNEYRIANIGGTLIPLGELPKRLQELDPNRKTIVLCHSGIRSQHAVAFLRYQGFTDVHNLSGGIDAWSTKIDPKVRRY